VQSGKVGGASFKKILRVGERIDAGQLRSHVLVRPGEPVALRAGYAVWGRKCNAVQRNRLRRLLREAFARERAVLLRSLEDVRCEVSVIFVLRCPENTNVKTIRWSALRENMETACRTIAARLESAP
jgi:ribonuclease P protein component